MKQKAKNTYEAPANQAGMAIAGLGFVILVMLISILLHFSQRDLIQRIADNQFFTYEEILRHDEMRSFLEKAWWVALFVSVTTFLAWFTLSYRNLYSFGAEPILRYSTRWTWLGFVIPILNLFRPYQVGAEIWDASDPQALSNRRGGEIVVLWWGSYLTMNILGRIASMPNESAQTIEATLAMNSFLIFLNIFVIFAALLAIQYICFVTERQEKTHAVLVASPSTATA